MTHRLSAFQMQQPRVFAAVGGYDLDDAISSTVMFDMRAVASETRFALSGAVFVSADDRRRSSPLDSPELRAQQEFQAMARAWRVGLYDMEAGSGPAELDQTVSALFRVLLRFGPGRVDLRDLPTGRTNAMHLTAVLGATFYCRGEVRGWNEALDVARAELIREGIDPDDALAGLDDEE
jgi:hypothetical protein